MACEPFRELLSARLDGEVSPDELGRLDDHLGTCIACQAYAYRLSALQRPLRLNVADVVPDLTPKLMATLPRVRRRLREDLTRVALASIALTQLVFAVPQLFAADLSEPIHTSRHLGSWDLAFAIGLLVVAWRPTRARGLLPMAAALALAMVATAGIDLRNGQAAGLAEASHGFEIAGVILIWVLARWAPSDFGPTATRNVGFGKAVQALRRAVPGPVSESSVGRATRRGPAVALAVTASADAAGAGIAVHAEERAAA